MESPEFRAVETIILASAPEKEIELKRLWTEYSPHFVLLDDRSGFRLEAGPYGIVQFTSRTMHQLWLLSFAAWRALHAFQSLLHLAYHTTSGIHLPLNALTQIPDQAEVEHTYARIVDGVRTLNRVETAGEFIWPPTIPHPTPTTSFATTEDQASFELCAIATAFAFLHEMRHVTLAADGSASPDPKLEELECDRFAREFLLDSIGEYAVSSGDPEYKVRLKRAAGVALNAYFILVLTPPVLWCGSEKHPSVRERFEGILDATKDVPPDSWFWSMLCSWLIAHLKHEGRLPSVLEGRTIQDLWVRLLNELDRTEPGHTAA